MKKVYYVNSFILLEGNEVEKSSSYYLNEDNAKNAFDKLVNNNKEKLSIYDNIRVINDNDKKFAAVDDKYPCDYLIIIEFGSHYIVDE